MASQVLNTNKCIEIFVNDRKKVTSLWVIFEENVLEASVYNLQSYDVTVKMNQQAWLSFLSEVKKSIYFRRKILGCFERSKTCVETILIDSHAQASIDYIGGGKLQVLVNERAICDTAMSYLSTLGGAFSALGDSFAHCAEKAGEISLKQLQIAVRLGEEPLLARCRLYIALSLIQQGKLETAKELITQQYKVAKRHRDTRLSNMCKGVWAKLKYTKSLEKQNAKQANQRICD